eukprot:CAMPEP_0170525926 /NCGR_PEP_ID=MMETSP0209-20121228/11373_1 /TAXON_ID=665100 ORGANISM="Litonotus pictus, Strain P1" /NCGR_SAMPLE_ID=MMETSP0209 /ASSEMBLY_ACC=CAM_ASM_000301 /LENGTH=64 /DNA_ID=CAMNT_0010815457 /DNA_START=288 /DNA_END=482 /DNA_ORIENTATION=-
MVSSNIQHELLREKIEQSKGISRKKLLEMNKGNLYVDYPLSDLSDEIATDSEIKAKKHIGVYDK